MNSKLVIMSADTARKNLEHARTEAICNARELVNSTINSAVENLNQHAIVKFASEYVAQWIHGELEMAGYGVLFLPEANLETGEYEYYLDIDW